MPPRRSARLVELANPHFQLPFPPNVVALFFSLLPLDARLRAREVCRGWRFFLEDACFWTHVDLSKSCGVNPRFLFREDLALIRAACARAKGALHALDLSGVDSLSLDEVAELVAENGESLRALTTPYSLELDAENVARLREAAPLCVLNCLVKCDGAEAVAMMRCELVCPYYLQVDSLDTQQQQTDFAAALASRTGMKELYLENGNLAGGAELEDLSRATIAAGVERVFFLICRLTPMALPALTLLLRPSALRSLSIYNDGVSLFTGPDLPAFCDALRSNSIPDQIILQKCDLWADPADAGMVLAALAARTTPFSLGLDGNRVGETQAQQFAAGTQLAQLITAGGLEELNLNDCNLGEIGLVPIFKALSRATRLNTLWFNNEEMSREFARDVVLPAVRANTSLRRLDLRIVPRFGVPGFGEQLPELLEAMNIVTRR